MSRKTLIFLTALALMTGHLYGKAYQFLYQKDIPVGDKPELAIFNHSGAIAIAGSTEDMITIKAVKNVRAADPEEAERVGEHIQIDVAAEGSKITVKTEYHRLSDDSSIWEKLFGSSSDSFGRVDYSIKIPEDCRLAIENSSGDISIDSTGAAVYIVGSSGAVDIRELKGDLDINTVSGDISLNNVDGNVNILTAGSDIFIDGASGDIEIKATSGKKEIKSASGPIRISQTSGTIALENHFGDIRIESISGKIDIDQQSGHIEILSESGDVEIKTELYSKKDFFVETTSGDISFELPELSSGSLRVKTTSGEVTSDFPLDKSPVPGDELEGGFGRGGPRITLFSETGHITIGEYTREHDGPGNK